MLYFTICSTPTPPLGQGVNTGALDLFLVIGELSCVLGPLCKKTLILLHGNNIGADQLVHPNSLISIFLFTLRKV